MSMGSPDDKGRGGKKMKKTLKLICLGLLLVWVSLSCGCRSLEVWVSYSHTSGPDSWEIRGRLR